MVNTYNLIDINTNDYLKKLDKSYKRSNGIYYTDLYLTDIIVNEVLKQIDESNVKKLKVLEPCVGSGNFIFSYLKAIINKFNLEYDDVLEVINNIYICDSDLGAVELFLDNLNIFLKAQYNSKQDNDFKINIGGYLIYDLNSYNTEYRDTEFYFGDIKFDLILTNPPYKSLRAEKRHYEFEEDYLLNRDFYKNIKQKSKKIHPLSGSLNANIYRYFLEDIFTKYCNENSIISVLVPSTILTDKSSKSIREKIVESNITNLIQIPETNSYISASQAMTNIITYPCSKDKVKIMQLDGKKSSNQLVEFFIDKENLIDKEHMNSIVIVKEEDYYLLSKLKKIKKIKDYDFINNMRGELDLTNNKSFIINKESAYKLIKGRNITRYKKINLDLIDQYVSEEFVKNNFKKNFIEKNRLVCQQIVNINKKNRIGFTMVEENIVLGNSCNFLTLSDNTLGLDYYYLLAVLNSKYINWYFKLFSSNNHINNYEIDLLPLPIGNVDEIKKLSLLGKQQLLKYSHLKDEEINALVKSIIERETGFSMISSFINDENISNIAQQEIQKKQSMMEQKKILNDHNYSLSDLDKEIIKSVPPGGNWKNIPQQTMDKSKRLLGIQKSGGRTTLYGRLKYDSPSYTITTYFNRPGNGCYIHPTQDRVLNTREAARLQGFPDSYYFYGNQRDILNQIGNAVPPLMGYLLGKKIKERLDVNNSLDLFSGAGGLFYGVKNAGIKHLIANDIDKSACVTLKVNNPEVNVLHDDISNSYVKQNVIKLAKNNDVDIVCGGPPCQGFSLAGLRKDDDPRNNLVIDFVNIIKEIQPKALLFENVIGILSYNKGQTIKNLKELFSTIGYKIHAETLDFSDYGIPQRRKRVIIIGVRNDLGIEPFELIPDKLTKNSKITVFDAIGDLDEFSNVNISESKYLQLIKGDISYEDYYEYLENVPKIGEQLSIF